MKLPDHHWLKSMPMVWKNVVLLLDFYDTFFYLGSTIDPGSTTFGVNALSFSLYSSVYKSRPDINCIIHVQTPAVTAVSAIKLGLLELSHEASVCGPATTHEIQIDLSTNELSLGANLQQSTEKILILPNHGILACGSTVEDAWHKTFHLILACEAQLRAVSMGINNLIISSVTHPIDTGGVNTADIKWAVGELEWSTLMIVLDKAVSDCFSSCDQSISLLLFIGLSYRLYLP